MLRVRGEFLDTLMKLVENWVSEFPFYWILSVCVYVCVCERGREIEREREKEKLCYYRY
jgi:hypothetical protein